MWQGPAQLGSPHGQVHRPDGKQREGVHLDHDGHESQIEQNLDEACGEKVCREQVTGLGGRAGETSPGQGRPRLLSPVNSSV